MIGGRLFLASLLHFALQRQKKPVMDILRDGLGLHPLVNLDGLFRGITHHPTVGTFGKMRLKFLPQSSIDAVGLVQEVREFR